MAISFMNWHPDTCNCIIEQTHDPVNPAYGVQFSKVVKKCLIHEAVPDNQLNDVIYANADSDQKRKNILESYILETAALGLSNTTLNPDGSTIRIWKSGVTYKWSFTGTGENRVLNVEITGINLSSSIKNAIQNWCDSTFGMAKVKII